jgi:Xaa-Pro aminopeptidase
MIILDKDFFKKNRERLMERIEDNSIVVLFAGKAPKKSADEAYPFTPNRNFYYLTGIDEDKIILVLTKISGKLEEILFIQKADPVMARWVGETINDEQAKQVSAIENIAFLEEFETRIHRAIANSNIKRVYADLERDSWDSPQSTSEIFVKALHEKYPYVEVNNVFPMVCDLRTIKSEEEVAEIKEAIRITNEGIKNLMKNAKPGMREYEMEAYFDFALKINGVKDFAFKTIAAGGKNATVLHYVDNDSVVNDGDLVLLDLGAQHNYYNGDISRTFPVNGKFTERQKQIYNIVLKAQLETMKFIKAGVPFKEVNLTTRRVLLEELSKIGLVKDDRELSQYYFHGVSHYLGLDTHDVGSRDLDLKPGMILTVEPGLYIEEEGIGIRIEDDVLVAEDGCINLSEGIIKTVEEIEEFLSRR